jgi:hypothetical protein
MTTHTRVLLLWLAVLSCFALTSSYISRSFSTAVQFRTVGDLRILRHGDVNVPVNHTEAMVYLADMLDVLYPAGKAELGSASIAQVLNNGENHRPCRTTSLNYSWYPVDCSVLGYSFVPMKTIVDDKDTKVWIVEEMHSGDLYIWKRYKLFAHYTVEMAFFSIVDHPRIGRPLCTFMESTATGNMGSPGVILEVVLGMSSSSYFRQFNNLLERHEQLGRIAAQVYDVYNYIHWLGYIHGDVKPSNILIDTDGNAVVIDFGFSVPMPFFKVGQGTPNTIAPEMVKYISGPYLDNTDWYSFAQMLVQWAVRAEPGFEDYAQSKFWSYKYELSDYPLQFLSPDLRQLLFYFGSVDSNQRRFNTRQQQRWVEQLPFWKHHNFTEMRLVWESGNS